MLTHFEDLVSFALRSSDVSANTILKINDKYSFIITKVIHYFNLKTITLAIDDPTKILKVFSSSEGLEAELRGYRLCKKLLPIAQVTHVSEPKDHFQVIIYEKLSGQDLLHEYRSQPYQVGKKYIQSLIKELYIAYSGGLMQHDMSPGNFFVTDDKQIVYLDYMSFRKIKYKMKYRFVMRLVNLFSYFELEKDGKKLIDECFNYFLSIANVKLSKKLYLWMFYFNMKKQDKLRAKIELKYQHTKKLHLERSITQ